MSFHSDYPIKMAVVGDIHHQWEEADNLALKHLGIDLVLFVGDFGNEAVDIVQTVAALDIPFAAIMGNHDAWYTASVWGQKQSPYDHDQEDWVQEQLDLLGDAHIGYSKLDFPQWQLSIVGSRPFSWGGSEWKNRDFLQTRYGIKSFKESIRKIVANIQETAYNTLIFLGHNGPLGLGDQPEDICGQDWQPLGGDHGDPDFTEAIAYAAKIGKQIPLVTFGHMHHHLRHTKARLRTMLKISPEGTIYLNAASVPRIKQQNGERLRNFTLVTLQKGVVTEISLVWMGKDFRMVSEQQLYPLIGRKPCAPTPSDSLMI